MARSVDKVESIFLTFIYIIHLDRVALDSNAFLLLKVHGVKDLILHITRVQSVGNLEHSVCEGTFSMVDMRDDAKVSCVLHLKVYNRCKDSKLRFFSLFLFNPSVDLSVLFNVTDDKIIELYSCGRQEEAFNGIVDAYTERLYWHVRRFLCSHDDSNDLLQDIFIKIWTALPTFRQEARLYTWLYRIATNEVLNYLRKQKVKAFISLDSASGILERKIDEDAYFNGDELQRELHKAIQRLPEKQRIVFSLRYFDEMKYEDISEITDTSVGALKASYHHAYNKVKSDLQKLF